MAEMTQRVMSAECRDLTWVAVVGRIEPATPRRGILGWRRGRTMRREPRVGQSWMCLLLALLVVAMGLDGFAASNPMIEPTVLTADDGYEKYPSLAVASDGTVWMASVVSDGTSDTVVVRRHGANGWSVPERVDAGEGCEGHPRLAVRRGVVWVVWHGRRAGRWAVYARAFDGGSWRAEQRVSTPTTDALNVTVAVDQDGRLWAAWEVGKPGGFEIRLANLAEGSWSQPAEVAMGDSDRRPALSPHPQGGVVLAWDSARSGHFGVWLTRASADGPGPPVLETPVAVVGGEGIADSPAVACAPDGTVWVAWHAVRRQEVDGQRLRKHWGDVFLTAVRDGRRWAPAPLSDASLPGQVSLGHRNKTVRAPVTGAQHWRQTNGYPAVIVDRRGRVWVIWRSDERPAHNFDLFARVWDEGCWSEVLDVTPFSPGRDEWPSLAVAADGSVLAAWEGQRFDAEAAEDRGAIAPFPHKGASNIVIVGSLPEPSGSWADAPLQPAPSTVFATGDALPSAVTRPPDSSFLTTVFFGDPHSHSVLSDAATGWPDQILVLARDVLGLDFAVVSDHAEFGRLLPGEWAELQLTASVFSQPGRFVSLSGWEWSAGIDFGHRIVLYPDESGVPLSSVSEEGDTISELYHLLRRDGGIASPHHTANALWGRWNPDAHHEESLEPNFEIASWHGRFEYFGNPGAVRPQVPGHHYQDALRRGRHLGVMAASDTHDLVPGDGGLTAVLVDTLDRSSVFAGIAARRCYATSGPRIGLDVQVGGGTMGSRVTVEGPVEISIQIAGTAPIERVEVVRNLEDWYAAVLVEQEPDGEAGAYHVYDPARPQARQVVRTDTTRELQLRFNDATTRSSETSYYVRVTQADGHQAWSSPVWVRQGSEN